MALTRHDIRRIAREVCDLAELDPDNVYRLVLYAAHPDDNPGRVGTGLLAYIYLRRDGKKYLGDNGQPATEVREFNYLPELP